MPPLKQMEHMIAKMAAGRTCIAIGCKTLPNSSKDHFCEMHWRAIPFDIRKLMINERVECLKHRKWSKKYLRLAYEGVFHSWTFDNAEKAKPVVKA